MTLPQLELMGLVTAARVGNYIKNVFKDKIERVVFWSDSTIALYWVKGCAERWKQFVGNRVIEIQQKTSPSDWYYCPSEDNPTDLLTKGVAAENLVLNEKWWLGPVWLWMNNECWPKQIVKASVHVDNVDVLREQRGNTVNNFAIKLEIVDQPLNKFSARKSYKKLLHVV